MTQGVNPWSDKEKTLSTGQSLSPFSTPNMELGIPQLKATSTRTLLPQTELAAYLPLRPGHLLPSLNFFQPGPVNDPEQSGKE